MHLGPAICGKCYEVSADVYAQLTGRNPGKPTTVDLRALIADHARAAGCHAHHDEPVVHAVRQRSLLLASRRRRGPTARRDDRRHAEQTSLTRAVVRLTRRPSRRSTFIIAARPSWPRVKCGGGSPHFFVLDDFLDAM